MAPPVASPAPTTSIAFPAMAGSCQPFVLQKNLRWLFWQAKSEQGAAMERMNAKANRWDDLAADWCPVARAMSVIGDRWTLLIVRDCFLGKSRFEQFQSSLGVTRHVLADRLKRLVEQGVLEKNPYQSRPVRYDYRLT